jgi:hypothetical protein
MWGGRPRLRRVSRPGLFQLKFREALPHLGAQGVDL